MSLTPSDDEADRTETQQQTCTAGNVFVFEHSPLAQASALDRKKKRDELTLAQQAYVSLCPNEMIACTVPGIDGAYEVSHILSSRIGADSSASTPRPSLNHVVVVFMVSSTTTVLWTTPIQDPSKSPSLIRGLGLTYQLFRQSSFFGSGNLHEREVRVHGMSTGIRAIGGILYASAR